MKASVYAAPQKFEIREIEVPSISDDEVLLKVDSCGVCGTDIVKYQHHLVKPPVVLGHEVAGYVEKTGKNVTKCKVGDRIVVAHHTPCYSCHFCKHGNVSMCETFKRSNLDPGGFAEYLRIPATHVSMTAHKIPDHLSFDEAIFMEPLACILRNIKRANLQPSDSVLIVGLGSVGLLTAMALRHFGMRVFGIDLREDRIETARHVGVEWAGKPGESLDLAISTRTNPRGVDLVVLTAGNAKVYSESVRYVRDGGAVNIFAGLGPNDLLTLPVNEIYKREITIYASYSPSPVELFESLDLISQRTVDVRILKPKIFALNELESAIHAVQRQEIFKAVIAPHIEYASTPRS